MDIKSILYDKVKSVISTWCEEDIYAISFFVYSNGAYEYQGHHNVSVFAISYNTEADCKGAGPLDEKRWNYAFWRQDETPIIDIDDPNAEAEALYAWYAEQGIDNIGYESTENQYDEQGGYIGKGPVGHYELVGLAADVAQALQEEGFVSARFGKPIPIIIHGLEYAWYDLEATKRANPHGEADNFLQAMENGLCMSFADEGGRLFEKKYPFALFLIGFLTNVLFRFFWLFVPGVVLMIVGIFIPWCLYIGLALLGIDLLVSLIDQLIIRHTMLSESDNEDFRGFQKAVSKDGNVIDNINDFVADAVENHRDE